MFESGGAEGSVFEAGGLGAGSLTPGWAPPDPDDPWSDYWGEPLGDPIPADDPWSDYWGEPLGDPIPAEVAEPGNALAGADWLAGIDLALVLARVALSDCSADRLLDAIAGWERVTSWARAAQGEALAMLTRCPEMRPDASAGRTFGSLSAVSVTAAEVAAALSLTSRQAENLVGEAVRLVEDFPTTHAALAAGRLDARRVKVIVDELGGQDPAVRRAVEDAVLAPPPAPADPGGAEVADVSGMDSTVLRRRVRVAVHEVAPVTTVQRNARARAGRFVRVSPAADGMAWLEALLPAEDAAAVKTAIDAAAGTLKRRDRAAGDPGARTADQRRADALAALAWASLGSGLLGGHAPQCHSPHGVVLGGVRGRRAAVEVTVSLTTLAGLDDQPGELAGYGPIPARVARELSAAGAWRWILRDPGSGALLDLGRTRYIPTTGLAEFIAARDRECVMPGCHRPAPACQIDHTVPFPHGPTAASNLGPLCQPHHLLKHTPAGASTNPNPAGSSGPAPPAASTPSTPTSRTARAAPRTPSNSTP